MIFQSVLFMFTLVHFALIQPPRLARLPPASPGGLSRGLLRFNLGVRRFQWRLWQQGECQLVNNCWICVSIFLFYPQTHIYIYICICIYVYMCVFYVHVYLFAYLYIYICIYIYTYMCIYVCLQMLYIYIYICKFIDR